METRDHRALCRLHEMGLKRCSLKTLRRARDAIAIDPNGAAAVLFPSQIEGPLEVQAVASWISEMMLAVYYSQQGVQLAAERHEAHAGTIWRKMPGWARERLRARSVRCTYCGGLVDRHGPKDRPGVCSACHAEHEANLSNFA